MWRSTIEVLTFPTVRDRGRDVPDFTATPTAVPIRGVDVQPGASTELAAQRRDATLVRWTVYVGPGSVPEGVSLTEGSIVRLAGGDVCEVDGLPMAWVEGSAVDHILLALKEWVH